jgi:hypothetical protein
MRDRETIAAEYRATFLHPTVRGTVSREDARKALELEVQLDIRELLARRSRRRDSNPGPAG